MTYDALIVAVRQRMDRSKPTLSYVNTTAHDALCWFIAVHEARCYLDSMSLKDVAQDVQEGNAIAGPYKTREDVERWIATIEDIEEQVGNIEEGWPWIDEALDKHFGL